MKVALILGVVCFSALLTFGQTWSESGTKTVTNSNLESIRQKRLAAEGEYKKNYEQMGFPSPQELRAQYDQELANRLELAQQLRLEKIEREKIQVDREKAVLQARIDAARIAADIMANEQEAAAREEYNQSQYPTYGYPGYGYPGYGYPRNGRFGIRIGIGGPFPGYDPRYRKYRTYPGNRLLPNFGGQIYGSPFGPN